METASRRPPILALLTVIALLASLWLVFAYAPVEREQGIVQKIFYVHVPLAWNAFLGFLLVFIFSFRYISTREKRYDQRAYAAAEVGVLFNTLVLITGPIWAKPIWGIWWTWDARLTLTLVLWLIYVGYLMLRHYVDNPEKRATLSAVVGIVGFIDVPLVYFAIRWWRTQHPKPVIAGGEGSGMDPKMATAFWVSVLAFTLLYAWLYRRRVEVEELREAQDEIASEGGVA